MNKSTLKAAALLSVLLLTACTAGEVEFTMWAIALLFVGAFVWGIVQNVYEKTQREAARSTAMARMPVRRGGILDYRPSVTSSNMLIDVKGRGGIAIDTTNKQIGILRGRGDAVRPTMISCRDVLSSEIIEDGETVTKTSRGSQVGGALIGGLALGGVGAVIGALSGSTKSAEKVSKIALMITINNVSNPVHYVMLLDDEHAIKKSHRFYKDAMGEAQKWHGKIQVLIRQADEEDRRQEQENAMKTVAVAPQASLMDELAKLGELRDRGVLTEAEFASQKAKLLK